MALASRNVVLGLGNLLLSDEGLGIHALSYLQIRLGRHVQAEWVDGGVLGLNLLPLIEDCNHLLVIDAIDAGLRPGSILEIDPAVLSHRSDIMLSEHQLTFQDVLGIARMLDKAPARTHLVGIQPGNLVPGTTLSREVAAALPMMVRCVYAVLNGWGLANQPLRAAD